MEYIRLLELEDVRGNSKFPGHWEDIAIDYFSIPSWHMPGVTGGGMGVGKPRTTNVDITLELPMSEFKAGQNLLGISMTDKIIPKGRLKLIGTENGVAVNTYRKIIMSKIKIVFVHFHYTARYFITLNAGKIDMVHPSPMESFGVTK